MKYLAIATAVTLLALSGVRSASADQSFTVMADTTMDGHAGTLILIQDVGFSTDTAFAYEEGGFLRFYAIRNISTTTWELFPNPVYIVPTTGVSVGMTWRWFDTDAGQETQAKIIKQEFTSTNEGPILAWKVDVTLVSDPSHRTESLWFADGIGLVHNVEYFDQWIQWEEVLNSHSTSGSGLFPLVQGNFFALVGGDVPNLKSSLGALKGHYGN